MTLKNAFRSGQLHVTDSMPINRIDRYRREHPEFLRVDPYLGTYFYRVNVTRPPLNNRLVRRALAMAPGEQEEAALAGIPDRRHRQLVDRVHLEAATHCSEFSGTVRDRRFSPRCGGNGQLRNQSGH